MIDDWSYGYLDTRNIRRFLRNTGVLLSKQELIALIRRIDLDGDAKVSYEEFFEGVKSQYVQHHRIGKSIKSKGVLSSQNGNTSTLVKSASKRDAISTPVRSSAKKRPKSANKTRAHIKLDCLCQRLNQDLVHNQSPERRF